MPELKHIIGEGSSYDVDMVLMESFVRSRNEPDNIIAQTSVFTYYISQIYNYWEIFKRELGTPRPTYKPEIIAFSNLSHKLENRNKRRLEVYGVDKLIFSNGDDYLTFEEEAQEKYPLPYDEIYTYQYLLGNEGPDGVNPPDSEFLHKLATVKNGKEELFIIQNINYYEERLLYFINKFQEDFQITGNLHVRNIATLMRFLSSLMCLTPLGEFNIHSSQISYNNRLRIISRGDKYYMDKISEFYGQYYLLNNTGLFGFNSYLYAFFSGVLIDGIPTHHTEYDNFIGCSYQVLIHDYSHDVGIVENKQLRLPRFLDKLRYIYYSILNSPDLSKKFKELLILYLWTRIHEDNSNDFADEFDFDSYVSDLSTSNSFAVFFPIISSEINSFIDELQLRNYKSYIVEQIPEAEEFLIETGENSDWYLLMLFSYLYIKNRWMSN